MLAGTILELRLFEFYDTRNLTAIFKENLVNEYFTSKLRVRLLNQFDELNNIVEAGQDAFNFLTSIDNSTLYCETIDFKLAGVIGADKKAHWYITKIEQSEDGGVYLFLKRDTLRDFYSLYSGDSVIVKTETQPTSSLTHNSGQNLEYQFLEFSNQVKDIFPYLYVQDTDWLGSLVAEQERLGKSIFLISIINNQAEEYKNIAENLIDLSIGQDIYIADYTTLSKLIQAVTSPNIWEQIVQRYQGQNPAEMIRRIQRVPFELSGKTIRLDDDEPNTKGYIPVGFDAGISVTKEAQAEWGIKFLKRELLCTSPNYNVVEGYGFKSLGHSFTFSYDLASTEKLEIFLPFIECVDLTGYLKFFNGSIVADYLIDTGTGNGVVGLHSDAQASFISENNQPKFELVIPFNCYSDVDWIGVQSNQLDRAFSAISSLVGLASGGSVMAGIGAVNTLTSTSSTQIIQGKSNQSLDKFVENLCGKSKRYGVRITSRDKGVVNQGQYHELQAFSTLTSVATVPQPTSDYNIITVDIAKRSWTGDDAIDNDIYTKLTQGGFVFNG